jgi:uncharacterized repeat protein (TIGR03803 family)
MHTQSPSSLSHSTPQLRLRSVALAATLLTALLATPRAQAQTFIILGYFGGADGAFPNTGVVRDAAGNLYGTAKYGGRYQNCDEELGGGTVYGLNASGTPILVYEFNHAAPGCLPTSGVTLDPEGNLYGTTAYSTVYKTDSTGHATLLYQFLGVPDGSLPSGGLLRDAQGDFYGTTQSGGLAACAYNLGCGTIFKLDASGHESVLYRFTGAADGAEPQSNLIQDAAGNLYGTAYNGGGGPCLNGCGTAFKLNPSGNLTVLHTFKGGADGFYPTTGLILDSANNLYGVTANGGDLSCAIGRGRGCGTVFRLNASGRKTVLYTFEGGTDGAAPAPGLAMDSAGNLYGATGGGDDHYDGTVFKLDTTGKKTVLHQFNGIDGSGPNPVILDAAGNLYGTTSSGGQYGEGTVFEIAP